MAKRSRRSLTLIEIMIVLFLIGMVISVLTYSMKGSMDEGKAFKVRQRALQIEQLLTMVAAQEGLALETVANEPTTYLERSGLVPNAAEFIKDPWGTPMIILVDQDRIIATSDQYRKMMLKKYGSGWKETRD